MPRGLGGYLVITDPETSVVEIDTVMCRHCQRIVQLKPGTMGQVYLVPSSFGGYREEAGAYCSSCSGPLCLACEARGSCEHGEKHWERRLERYEARQAFLRSIGL